ncbi:MAG: DMT family transporter [Pseudomonadota bacterium]
MPVEAKSFPDLTEKNVRFTHTNTPLAGIPWTLLGCALTATSFLFSKLLGQNNHLSAIEINLYRSIVVCFLLASYAMFTGKTFRSIHIKEHWLRSTTGWGAAILQMYALNSLVPLPIIQMLSYTNPIFFVLIIRFWYKEPIALKIWGGVILGFLGTVILLNPRGLAADHSLMYLFAALGSGLLTALTHINIQGLTHRGEPIWRIVCYYSLISIVYDSFWFALPFNYLQGIHTTAGMLLGTGLGIFILFGQISMATAYSKGNPSITTIFSYSHLIYATLFSLLIFNQGINFVSSIGILIIVCGGLLTMGIKRSRLKPRVLNL